MELVLKALLDSQLALTHYGCAATADDARVKHSKTACALVAKLLVTKGLRHVSVQAESDGVAALIDGIRQTTKLERVDLSGSRMGHRVPELVPALQANTRLQVVNVASCILDRPAVQFLRGLRACARLRQLDLSKNLLKREFVATVAEELGHLTTLRKLNLSYNDLDSEGTGHIARALGHAKELHDLDLSNNRMRRAGATAVVAELSAHASLRCLNLGHNPISNKGGKAMAQHLWKFSSLHALELAKTGLGDEGIEWIVEALRSSRQLKRFIAVCGNRLTDTSLAVLIPGPVAWPDPNAVDHDASTSFGDVKSLINRRKKDLSWLPGGCHNVTYDVFYDRTKAVKEEAEQCSRRGLVQVVMLGTNPEDVEALFNRLVRPGAPVRKYADGTICKQQRGSHVRQLLWRDDVSRC